MYMITLNRLKSSCMSFPAIVFVITIYKSHTKKYEKNSLVNLIKHFSVSAL